MESVELFQTFSYPTALSILLLTAFSIAIKALWKYFTSRVSELEGRIDTLIKQSKTSEEAALNTIQTNTEVLKTLVDVMIANGAQVLHTAGANRNAEHSSAGGSPH